MLNVYFKILDSITLPILEELREKRYKGIKCWFKDNDKDQKPVLYIRDSKIILHQHTDKSLTCYNWDITTHQVLPEHDGLEHLAWRHLQLNEDFVCIDNCSHCNDQLVLFQDAPHKKDYPQTFIKVPCFHQTKDLMDYAQAKGAFSFTLKDNNRFKKCNSINPIQGAIVYKEIATGHFWYLDMFHKTHYEVFDHTGKHLGEANLDGVLDTKQKDNNKTITT